MNANRSITRLRWICCGIFLALLLPSIAVLWQGFNSLRYESFHRAHALAEAVATQMNDAVRQALLTEEQRPATDYDFFVLSGDRYVQRSPLASLDPGLPLPGLVGFFQIDDTGTLSAPFVPPTDASAAALTNVGLSEEELVERKERESTIRSLLEPLAREVAGGADLATKSAGTAETDTKRRRPTKQRTQLDDYAFNAPFAEAETVAKDEAPRATLTQENRQVLPSILSPIDDALMPNIASIVSDVDPLKLVRLDDAHFFAYRRVVSNTQSKVQGFVIEIQSFIDHYFAEPFLRQPLSTSTDLVVAFDNEVLGVFTNAAQVRSVYAPDPLDGTLILRTRLESPANAIELAFNARDLTLGAGKTTLLWSAALLLGALLGGIWLLYRLGIGQIRLAAQQRDFVASVSHELKTPLTAIRMYGEMLKSGWAQEDKKASYYDYIFSESERLSRLINNVLKLSRIDQPEDDATLASASASSLLLSLKQAASNHETNPTVQLSWTDDADGAMAMVAEDDWLQVMLNLIDNAVKFSQDNPAIHIRAWADDREVTFSVRDHGPGIPREHLKRIFEMFYRAEDELSRETVGTGIGLALVQQLTQRMGGRVDVANRNPGAEFTVHLQRG